MQDRLKPNANSTQGIANTLSPNRYREMSISIARIICEEIKIAV